MFHGVQIQIVFEADAESATVLEGLLNNSLYYGSRGPPEGNVE
jgi:hypothetical protein